MATNWAVFPEDSEPPKPVVALAAQVEQDGGRVLAVYQEPLEHAWQLFALLPLARVVPTPYSATSRSLTSSGSRRSSRSSGASSTRSSWYRPARESTGRRTEPPSRGAHQAQGRVDARHPHP